MSVYEPIAGSCSLIQWHTRLSMPDAYATDRQLAQVVLVHVSECTWGRAQRIRTQRATNHISHCTAAHHTHNTTRAQSASSYTVRHTCSETEVLRWLRSATPALSCTLSVVLHTITAAAKERPDMLGFAFSSHAAYKRSDFFEALMGPLPPSPPSSLLTSPSLSPQTEQLTGSDSSPFPAASLSSASTELATGPPARKRQRSSTPLDRRNEQPTAQTQQHNEHPTSDRVSSQPLLNGTNVHSDSDASDSDDEQQHKQHRTAVVAAAVNRGRELHDQLAFLHAACHHQHDEITQLRHRLDATTAALHAATQPPHPSLDGHTAKSQSASLDLYLGFSALNSSLLLAARVGICVTDGETGRLLDANAHLLHNSGSQRSDVIGRLVVTPFADVMKSETQWEEAVDRESDSEWASKQRQQYRSSFHELRRLYSAEADRVDAVWRCPQRGGRTIEFSCGCWVADWVSVDSGQARAQQQQPGRVVWVLSLTDARVLT